MGAFADRFETNSGKPQCYGDTEVHDPDHPDCRACKYLSLCRMKCQSIIRGTSSSTSSSGRTPYVSHTSNGEAYRPKTPTPTAEPDKDDTFLGVLVHNSSLNAVTAMSATLTDALGQLPRKRYPGITRRPVS